MLGWVSYICFLQAGVRLQKLLCQLFSYVTFYQESFGDPQLWRDAITQNAWDTGIHKQFNSDCTLSD